MNPVTRLILAMIALVIALVVSPLSATPANAKLSRVPTHDVVNNTSRTTNHRAFAKQVMVEINRERRAAGLHRVKFFDSCVSKLANRWSKRLARSGAFTHRNQSQVLRRCHQAWAGEALIKGTGLTPQMTVRAWMDSPGHRAILLTPRASRAGVAVRSGKGGMVGVLNFTDNR